MKDISFALRIAAALLALSCSSAYSQGQLSPPGAPAPTMKTLDQLDAKLEKRIPVDAANTPGNTIAEFHIRKAGSYYLTSNITTAKSTGIQITVAGVRLDLNGFQIQGAKVAPGSGIEVTGDSCTIRNGSISGFNKHGLRNPRPKWSGHYRLHGRKMPGGLLCQRRGLQPDPLHCFQ